MNYLRLHSSRRPFTSRVVTRNTKQASLSPVQIIIIGAIICLLFFYYLISSVGNIEVKKDTYHVSRGDTLGTLDEKFDLGVAPWRYSLWIKWFAPRVQSLQIGEYKLTTPTSLTDFFTTTLTKPIHTDETITILPGWNVYDIDAYLAGKNILKTGDFIREITTEFSVYEDEFDFVKGRSSLEGFLYPDTYRIKTSATARDVVRVLLKEFDKTLGSEYRELGDVGYKELILASIVQREERKSSEQPIVAGILAKRVREGIAMGADATVCTGYAKTQKQCTPAFIASVIYDKNLYNTRNMQGYTPTPISNVTKSVWENTRARQDSPYYYYLHDSDGVIHYAKTLEEHGANKQKYLQ